MTDWRTLSTKTVHQTAWFKLTEDKVLNQNGKELTYTYLEKGPSVGVVVVNENGDLLLQKQFAYPIKKVMWAIPAGFCDTDEPIKAAQRELYEETGLESDEWKSLGMFYSAAGLSNDPCYGFVTRVNGNNIKKRDKDEDLRVQQFVSESETRRMLNEFEIIDGFSIIPLYRYLYGSKL